MYRVMVADDEGIVIDSMKFIIEKEFGSTCQVECAKSGRSVIELAERYESTLPQLESDTTEYEAKVKSHLERMGFKWE